MKLFSQASARKTRHSVTLWREQISIGLFRSTVAQVRTRDDVASIARALSRVDGLSFKTDSAKFAAGTVRNFEIPLPVGGKASRFQWRFCGKLSEDCSAVIVQGYFRVPRILEVFCVVWFVAVALFVAFGAAIAITSAVPGMLLLPLGGAVVMSGGYATLFAGRALAEPAMHKVASQLSRCLAFTRGQ